MKKLQNNGLQITGIVLSLVGIATIVQPLIKALFGNPITYTFLGLLPEGLPSASAWAVILAIGLVLVSVTNPITTDKSE